MNESVRILGTLDRVISNYTQQELKLILQLPSVISLIANCANIGVSTVADGLALKGVIEQVQENLK